MKTRFDAEYVRRNCFISYRGSEEPQTIRFRARWAQPRVTMVSVLASVQQSLQEGFAGDATLRPVDSTAEWIDAPHMRGVSGAITELDAVLRVQSVSEWFVRYLAAMMVPASKELSIVGDLPLDATPASLDTERFLQRDMAPNAYPGRVEPLPFEIDLGEAPRGAAARIDYLGPVPKDYATGPVGFGRRMPRLGGIMTQVFWNRDHTQAGVCALLPKIKLGEREVSAMWPQFAVQPEAFINIFVNQLVWVHHREIPIARVSVQTS